MEGGGGKAAMDELLTCEKCGATYALHASTETGRKRLLCASCGDSRDLVVAPPAAGRWVLVDPTGRVSHFASFGELVGSRPSIVEEPLPRSGAQLLDTTPTPVAPKLALADSDREIEAARPRAPDYEDDEELSPLSSRDFVEVARPQPPDDELPLSTRDFVQVTPSKAPPVPADRPSRPAVPEDRPSQRSAPPPPAAGSLTTLPPKRPDLPPPTISVDEGPTSKKKPEPAPVSARPSAAAEEKSTSWLLPIAGIAAAGVLVWVLTRDSSPAPSSAMPSTTVTESASAPPPASAASSAPAVAVVPDEASAPVAAADAAVDAAPTERRPVDINTLSLAELLERAAGARRGGDRAHAKQLYDKALEKNPGNAEAYSGLGDLARAGGDLAGAKDAYGKALATSPSYFPALLGMADVEWDLGDQASARRRYAELAGRIGANAPARVHERAKEPAADPPP